jgi:hypothetical protein
MDPSEANELRFLSLFVRDCDPVWIEALDTHIRSLNPFAQAYKMMYHLQSGHTSKQTIKLHTKSHTHTDSHKNTCRLFHLFHEAKRVPAHEAKRVSYARIEEQLGILKKENFRFDTVSAFC